MKKSITSGTKYKLTRLNDGLVKQGDKVQFVIWKEDKTAEKMIDEPKIGTSLILDPRFNYAWLTTTITQIIEQTESTVKFQTENSTYLLEKL